jgi:hypothetical protein
VKVKLPPEDEGEGSQSGASRTVTAMERGGGGWRCLPWGPARAAKSGRGTRFAVGERSAEGMGGRGCGNVVVVGMWWCSIMLDDRIVMRDSLDTNNVAFTKWYVERRC